MANTAKINEICQALSTSVQLYSLMAKFLFKFQNKDNFLVENFLIENGGIAVNYSNMSISKESFPNLDYDNYFVGKKRISVCVQIHHWSLSFEKDLFAWNSISLVKLVVHTSDYGPYYISQQFSSYHEFVHAVGSKTLNLEYNQ